MYKKNIDNILDYKNLPLSENYNFPIITKQEIDLSKSIIPFNYAKSAKHYDKGVHFFIDDYQFERFWRAPKKYITMLAKFAFICTPDFSLYIDYPKAYQIANHFKKQALGALAQSFGLKVIPTLAWSDPTSFKWCFEGIEKGCVVAVSSVGCMNNKNSESLFVEGFKKAIEILEPSKILFLGLVPEQLKGYTNLIVNKASFAEKFWREKYNVEE